MCKKNFYLLIALFINTILFSQCWQQVSNGQFHTIAIKNDGTLWAWGWNQFGQLGNGNYSNSAIPIQIGIDNDWREVASGGGHSLAIKNNGTLWSWGRNTEGQLGINSTLDSNIPIQVGTDNDWKNVFGGVYVSAAIKNNFTLWGWGSNDTYHQLGQPTSTADILSPTQIGVDMDWKTISFGGLHTIALKNNNTLWSWGESQYGELGNGVQFSTVSTPTQVGTSSDWLEISSGFYYCMAIKNDGTLWSWGLGYVAFPVQNGPSNDWVKVSSYNNFNLAIKNDGSLWSWGNNSNGQLGNGNNTTVYLPNQIGNDLNWTKLSNGLKFSSAINSNSELKTFGQNNYGQLGNGLNIDSSTPLNVNCTNLDVANNIENYFGIVPNPAKDFILINNKEKIEIEKIYIIDLFGKTALTIPKENANSEIDLRSLPKGIYLMQIATSNSYFTSKLIKE